MTIDPNLHRAANQAAETLMQELKGVRAVVVCTEDGFEVASRVENQAQVSRLSAMASSLAALGALAGEEGKLGRCNNLVIQAEEGFMVIVQIHRADVTLIISVVTNPEAIIGQVLYLARQTATTLQAA